MKTIFLRLSAAMLLVALLMQSCAPKYGPAYLGSNNAYMAKPVYKGAKANAVSISGRTGRGVIYYDNEKNNSSEFAAHVSFMRKHFYYSGGFFGYWGKYQVDTIPGNEASGLVPFKYHGFGARHEIGTRIPVEENFEILLGLAFQTFNERGEFSSLTKDEAAEVITKVALFPFFGPDILDSDYKGSGGSGFGINMDFRYAPSQNRYFGLRYGWDRSKGEGFSPSLGMHQITLHGTINNFTAYGQIGFGSFQNSTFDIGKPLLSAGLTYAIPFGRKKDG
ncbi:MAG: hypothetical protein IPK76_15850 [Lewinellaceae bacterium]|jgi:hypothetical protein|nr:hypothetical protein [Lewinellaceae bacterium]